MTPFSQPVRRKKAHKRKQVRTGYERKQDMKQDMNGNRLEPEVHGCGKKAGHDTIRQCRVEATPGLRGAL